MNFKKSTLLVTALSTLAFAGAVKAQEAATTETASTVVEDAAVEAAPAVSEDKPVRAFRCRGVELTAAQQTQIQDAFKTSRASGKALATDLKAAHKAYVEVVRNPATTLEQADAAAAAISEKMAAVQDARLDFKHTVLFTIGTAEQRPALASCLSRPHHQRGHHGRMNDRRGGHEGRDRGNWGRNRGPRDENHHRRGANHRNTRRDRA